jgi:hypothetical protein
LIEERLAIFTRNNTQMKNVLIVLVLVSVSSMAQPKKDFGWLIGTWQEEGKQAFEVWKSDNEILSGESYKMKDGSKFVTEEIKLIKKGNDFYYVPDVAGPQGAIEFKVTSADKKSFTAENPEHDFPKKIRYEQVDETHLKATIGDANKKISYSFVKIK